MITKFDIIFITSCCDKIEINYLLNSINQSDFNLKIFIIIINMNGEDLIVDKKFKFNFLIINTLELLNSSKSRNLGIDYILQNKLTSYFVAFPDDDTTYDNNFFNFIFTKIYVENEIDRNYLCDVKCRDNLNKFYRKKISNTTFKVSKYNFDSVGAVNIILNLDTFLKVKYFNEKYGVGSIYGAGEDGDYFLRSLNFSDFFYIPSLYTIHPSVNLKVTSSDFSALSNRMLKYSRGVISVLCLHKMRLYACYISFRALGGVIINLPKSPKIAFLYFKIFFIRIFFLLKF